MAGSISIIDGIVGLGTSAGSTSRLRRSNIRADVAAMGYDLLLPWDMVTMGAAGIACDMLCGVFFGTGDAVYGLHEEALQLMALGPVLAPFILRDRRSGVVANTITAGDLMGSSLRRVFVLATILLAIGSLMQGVGRMPVIWMSTWFVSMAAAFMSGRLLYLHGVALLARRGVTWDRVAVVGSGPNAEQLRRRIVSGSCPGVRLVPLYRKRMETDADVDDIVADLVDMGRRRELDRVVLALPAADEGRLLRIAHRLKVLEIEVTALHPPLDFSLARLQTTHVAGVPQIVINGRPHCSWGLLAKEMEDRFLAALLLLWMLPLLAAIALVIRLDSPGPVIFRQRRHGRNGTEFEVLKFRTMSWHGAAATSGEVQTRRGDARVTRFGAFLRTTSLDELPQLFNVLTGTMSLVGPRPHPVVMRTEERLGDEIIAEYPHRHRVKPGITGWAQINGYRGATETAEQLRCRVEHDNYYIDNWSLLLDLRILVLTPLRVLLQRSNAF